MRRLIGPGHLNTTLRPHTTTHTMHVLGAPDACGKIVGDTRRTGIGSEASRSDAYVHGLFDIPAVVL